MPFVPATRALLVTVPLALALTACSAEPAVPDPQPNDASGAPTPATAGSGTASPLRLAPLEPAEIAANPLRGELGCHFAANGETLLLASGFVADAEAHAEGLVKTGETLQRLAGQEAGGFDALIDGTVLTSEGITYTISRTADEPLATGESPPYPAELTLRRAGGEQETRIGTWTCGP